MFVHKQEHADELMKNLLRHSYPCNSLHGGIDQYDRDSTMDDFKAGNVKLLVSLNMSSVCLMMFVFSIACFFGVIFRLILYSAIAFILLDMHSLIKSDFKFQYVLCTANGCTFRISVN